MIYKCFYPRCNGQKTQPFTSCSKCFRFPTADQMKILSFAMGLDNAQAKENNGQGVSCVQTIISLLFQNQYAQAKSVYDIDSDKICDIYPKLDKMICQFFKIEPKHGQKLARL